MLKGLIRYQLQKFSKRYNYETAYLEDILDSSTPLMLLYNKFVKLSGFQRKTPNDIFYIAKVAALKVGDCGPCLQLIVDFAREKGVSKEIVEKALRQPELLNPDQKLTYDFAFSVASNLDTHSQLSEEFEKKFGKDILVEVAMTIATSLVYPTLKRGLRRAHSCHLVQIKV